MGQSRSKLNVTFSCCPIEIFTLQTHTPLESIVERIEQHSTLGSPANKGPGSPSLPHGETFCHFTCTSIIMIDNVNVVSIFSCSSSSDGVLHMEVDKVADEVANMVVDMEVNTA